jgi:hypothetical protein
LARIVIQSERQRESAFLISVVLEEANMDLEGLCVVDVGLVEPDMVGERGVEVLVEEENWVICVCV